MRKDEIHVKLADLGIALARDPNNNDRVDE